MDHLKLNTDRTLARRIKQVTMSFNTKTSKYTFQNGHYVGQHCKKSKLFMAVTFKGGSVYHTVEELIVIAQGCYQVSTYKLVMTERHFNSSLTALLIVLSYRVFRDVKALPPTGRVEEIGANPHSGQREHHNDESIENDNTELSSSYSETGNTEATDTEPELSDDSKCELDGISSLFD